MRISDFAKELTKETGKQVTPNQIILLLSKKKDGLRAISNIDDDLMEYARIRITGKAPEKAVKKQPAAAKPAQAKKPAKKPAAKPAAGEEGKTAEPKKKPSASTRTGATVAHKRPSASTRPGVGRLTASTRPDAVIVPKPEPKPEKKKEEKAEVEEVKEAVAATETPVTETVENTAPVAETPVTENTVSASVDAEKIEENVIDKAADKSGDESEAPKAEETKAKEEVEKAPETAESKAETETADNDAKASDSKEADIKEVDTKATDAAASDAKAEDTKATEENVSETADSDKAVTKETEKPAQKNEKEADADTKKQEATKVAPTQTNQSAGQKPVKNDRNDRTERSDRGDKGGRSDRNDRFDRSGKPDFKDRGQRPDRTGKGPKSEKSFGDKDKDERPRKDQLASKDKKKSKGADSAEVPIDNKKSSSRKGDKSKDKEKEARRENRETRAGKREDRRNKKNDFRDIEDMGERKKKPVKKQEKKEEETIKTVTLPEVLTLSEFASKIKQPVNQLIKKLFMEGKMYTVNTDLTYEEAELIALEYNIICEQEVKVDIVEEALRDIEDPEESLVTRPPVVCVMGHVDHGKTSLLDAIRETSVTQGEAGGITQHIGAYTVQVNDKKITFLDTPGHEAFTSMRLRGAMATDIAILVVAADDGVMPQTVEAINHAKAAGVQIIVAVNKIDKPSANVERVKQELVEYGLVSEDWGGDTIFCPVSAKSKEGLDNLLEMILLTSDILELKANPKRKARGIVIEAKLDKGRGAVATLLVQKGTLKVGDFIAIGESHGRVRAMTDDKQKTLKEATPSMPVEIIGLSTVPNSGEIFIATDTEKEARSISDAFITRGKENLIAETKAKMSLDDIFSQMKEGTLKELNIIIKADVQGSVEALKQSLLKLSNNEVVIKCIHSGVGAINESDVSLAAASNAIIIGFNVRTEPVAKNSADTEKVDIRLYSVIYNAIDDIEAAMKGMLDPIFEEKVIGHVEVRQTFKASGIGTIAGSFVQDGAVERNAMARISRGGSQIWEGKIASLKRFNDDAKEVKAGYECGIVFENYSDINEGDLVEVYKMVEVPRD